MASCKPCAKGKHGKCVKRNAHKTTGCPACCQHRGTKHAVKVGTDGARH